MISKPLLLALPLLLGAATQTHAACDSSLVQSFVGKVADATTVEEAVKTANASLARTIPPPGIATKDFVQDRLNIYTDKDNKITSLSCDKGSAIKLQ